MQDEDYLNDEDYLEEDFYPGDNSEGDDDEDSEEDEGRGQKLSNQDTTIEDIDASSYAGRITSNEIWLCNGYDDIVMAGKKEKDVNALEAAALTAILANPKHNSVQTGQLILMELFYKQGHCRMVNSVYTPDQPLRGEDFDEDYLQDTDGSFNRRFAQEARDQISRFIDFLNNRDLSKDSIISARRKRRQLPAFIIFLFSSGMYDLIINCPSMPPEYQKQIDYALKRIMEMKYDVVEALAEAYEKAGRDKVAECVRRLQLAWFEKEPAEIKTAGDYSDLNLTYDDVVIYREYRSKFINLTKSITQDVISDLIEVVVDKEAGIYEKLKDKTRSDAIADVKQVYKEWAKENKDGSDLAKKVIWKEVN